MLKTARSYLHSSRQNTGMWRTDRQNWSGYYRAVCITSNADALEKETKKKKVQQRLLRPSGIPVFTVIFTVKFHYLHFPPLLLLLPNSITFKFHARLEIIFYLQIPILSNSIIYKFTQLFCISFWRVLSKVLCRPN